MIADFVMDISACALRPVNHAACSQFDDRFPDVALLAGDERAVLGVLGAVDFGVFPVPCFRRYEESNGGEFVVLRLRKQRGEPFCQ